MDEMKKPLTFKERWLLEDERCSQCNAITKRVRGITKQNIKRLLTPQFNTTELLITFILIMVIVMAFLYKSETQQCRDFIKNINITKIDYQNTNNLKSWNITLPDINFANNKNG